ncbi:unnamed protein product [Didymodactylos carnosus]|uniref:C2H2-type domain-containing protein n=1 Tax=Didymodactylos carnosus TaxID=1234261 RepID=A0A813W066_9BILA|nr:unnamed protein product [Didymodactylos carnosus]CAF0965367.1 unnamed protein product [Didymodactylos carnosus]CAF3633803.1 unnamed protein product [Didymodactylos carnosus]CAF3737354.1 unnamed protein product [Didymodactylos carnosus]
MVTKDPIDNGEVLDLSVKKAKPKQQRKSTSLYSQQLSQLLSPPSSTTSTSSSSSASLSPKTSVTTYRTSKATKRPIIEDTSLLSSTTLARTTTKRPLRFQCKYCDYKAPSTSLMQNHIYRHTDLTPYSCAYCGHKSTTKSTIMVHIELCHPNMEVKIIENRVRETDFYRDLNNDNNNKSSSTSPTPMPTLTLKKNKINNKNFSLSSSSSTIIVEEPKMKKLRSNSYDEVPINGVAISLKNIADPSSPLSDDFSDETENVEPLIDEDFDNNGHDTDGLLTSDDQTEQQQTLKLKIQVETCNTIHHSTKKYDDAKVDNEDNEYITVFNRPKQYFGSLYEPDKQYACKLCSYTTNHRPSMEDHVYVHTNEKPYRTDETAKCGYCGEEIYTRYAATYHIKYKHAGMPRNFIQNKADVTQYYVNRARKEDEKNQFKLIDTRRVRLPHREKSKTDQSPSKSVSSADDAKSNVSLVPLSTTANSSPLPTSAIENPLSFLNSSSNLTNGQVDYRFLLAWSYYLATQAWLSPLYSQQESTTPNSNVQQKQQFIQAMQAAAVLAATLKTPPNMSSSSSSSLKSSEKITDEDDSSDNEEVILKVERFDEPEQSSALVNNNDGTLLIIKEENEEE